MSARKLRPTGNKVLVRPVPVATHSESGLIELPVAYHQPSGQGIVLAVGPLATDLSPGDKVLYSWIDAKELEDDRVVILDQKSIIGIAI
jgi:co-chaperonin GroES (HSP10)